MAFKNLLHLNMEQTKKCSKCEEVKSLLMFYKDKRNKDGLLTKCILCCREKKLQYAKKYREKNKDKLKKYHNETRERRLLYLRDNKEYIRFREKLWRDNNKERIRLIKKRCLSNLSKSQLEHERERGRNKAKNNSETLKDSYIVQVIKRQVGVPVLDIKKAPELIELKREQLKLHRTIKQKENEQNSKRNSR